jgi:hypothetical protein
MSPGGYTKWVGVHSDEVAFRDTAHGFLAWAFATVIGAALLGGAATYLVGGALSGAAQGASQGAAASQGLGGTNDYFVDMLLRPASAGQGAAATQGSNDQAVRREIGRILVRGLREGRELAPADRAYLAQVVAARAGVDQAQADQRVSDVINQAKAAADEARRAAAKTALWMTAAMVIGAFAAALAAIEGGQLRDGRWRGVIGASNYRTQRTK